MTYAENSFHPGNWLRAWFGTTKAEATERRARHSAYVQTLHALQTLSDRELEDIGISRSSIKAIAQDAAYGGARP